MEKGERGVAVDAAFSYDCNQCGRCCVDKKIQVNPYEVARLARALHISSSQFRAQFTNDDVELRRDGAGRCIFFASNGCSVHADRPLVCRLFPLGRIVDADGIARYVRVDFDLPARGEFGTQGTIADYVATQHVNDFTVAADGYFRWYLRATDDDASVEAAADEFGNLLDIDEVVDRYCATNNAVAPVSLAERCSLHLQILDSLIT